MTPVLICKGYWSLVGVVGLLTVSVGKFPLFSNPKLDKYGTRSRLSQTLVKVVQNQYAFQNTHSK